MENGDECSAHETSVEVNDESKKPAQKKMRELKSSIWTYFKKNGRDKEGVEIAICKSCMASYKVGSTLGPNGKNYGTSHLKRHLLRCKKLKFYDLGQIQM